MRQVPMEHCRLHPFCPTSAVSVGHRIELSQDHVGSEEDTEVPIWAEGLDERAMGPTVVTRSSICTGTLGMALFTEPSPPDPCRVKERSMRMAQSSPYYGDANGTSGAQHAGAGARHQPSLTRLLTLTRELRSFSDRWAVGLRLLA